MEIGLETIDCILLDMYIISMFINCYAYVWRSHKILTIKSRNLCSLKMYFLICLKGSEWSLSKQTCETMNKNNEDHDNYAKDT